MAWLALAIAIAANVVANVSLKLAVKKSADDATGYPVISFLLQPWTWVGLFTALILLGSYLIAIRDLGLGFSYAAVTSLALVLVTITAVWAFEERLTAMTFVGMGLIILGITVLTAAELVN